MNDKAEEWRTVLVDPNYEVSNLGRVRRVTPHRATTVGKILKPQINKDGHYRVSLSRKWRFVHRLVAQAFHGNPPTPHHLAAHNDGVPSGNTDDNIRWATSKENHEDRLFHGTHIFGEQNPNVKLSDEDVRLIRARFHLNNDSKALLSRLFDVSDAHIHSIVTGSQRYSAGGYL